MKKIVAAVRPITCFLARWAGIGLVAIIGTVMVAIAVLLVITVGIPLCLVWALWEIVASLVKSVYEAAPRYWQTAWKIVRLAFVGGLLCLVVELAFLAVRHMSVATLLFPLMGLLGGVIVGLMSPKGHTRPFEDGLASIAGCLAGLFAFTATVMGDSSALPFDILAVVFTLAASGFAFLVFGHRLKFNQSPAPKRAIR